MDNIDISPEAVDWLIEDFGFIEGKRVATMLRALRSALTASEKDAARYRWLRGCSRDALSAMGAPLLWGAEHLDEHIDAAMEKANG